MATTLTSIKLLGKLAKAIHPYQLHIELALVFLFLVGLLMKDPALSPMLTQISLGTLSALFAIMAFNKGLYSKKVLQYFHQLLYLALAAGVMGVLHILMHLPGALILCNISGIALVVLLIWAIVLISKNQLVFKNSYPDIIRILLVGGSIIELL